MAKSCHKVDCEVFAEARSRTLQGCDFEMSSLSNPLLSISWKMRPRNIRPQRHTNHNYFQRKKQLRHKFEHEPLMKHAQHTTHMHEHKKLRITKVKNGHNFGIWKGIFVSSGPNNQGVYTFEETFFNVQGTRDFYVPERPRTAKPIRYVLENLPEKSLNLALKAWNKYIFFLTLKVKYF